MGVPHITLVPIRSRLEGTVLTCLIHVLHGEKRKRGYLEVLSDSTMTALPLSSSVSTRIEDINWCTEVISTLGTVNTLREHFFVKAHVCQLLMQCSTLTADTTDWVRRHASDPGMIEPLDRDPSRRSLTQRALLNDFNSQVLEPVLNNMFRGLDDLERQRRSARLQLYGCWAPSTTHDEIIEALLHGYVYIVACVFGSILNASRQVDSDQLFNVCSDILFPHTDPSVLRASTFVYNSTIADQDTQLASELADRYTNMANNQRSVVLYKADKPRLVQHFTRMIKYARQFSQYQPHTSTVSERLNNRIRAFAYQYDGWCATLH